MPATRRIRSKSRSSRKNKSSHSYFMRGCARRSNSNKNHFFAKGMRRMKKCKCACQLDKHHRPECKCNCHETSKYMKGGDALNLSLAYTGKQVPLNPSPYAAYVGKGGNKAYPIVSNTGGKMGWLNPGQTIRGGGITGPGTSYANGLVGSAWSGKSDTWPGVNGVGGDSNHLKLNTYNNDISRQMLDVGANFPFNGMLRGGGRRHRGHRRHSSKYNSKSKKMHRGGGGLLPQNLVNVGRNFMYNIGASNNEMNGYAAPTNPMPYKDQLVSNNSKFFNL